MPIIDPGEILSDMEQEEKEKKEKIIKETKGRIRRIQKLPKKSIGDIERKNNDKEGTNENDAKSGTGSGGNEGNGRSDKKNEDKKPEDDAELEKQKKKKKQKEEWSKRWKEIVNISKKCLETGLITMASLAVLVLGGVLYHKLYKRNVLWKMDQSFDANASLMLAKHQDQVKNIDKELWAERTQQELIDEIVTGKVKGKYYLLLGEKGTGKTSAVMESISRAEGRDCAIIDCSSDVELMRLRIGHALNFEFFEDYIGSLFSMKGPRESTPTLDIERAFMKLEQILVDRRSKTNKPLVLVFNNSHLVDPSLVELLQQKAENFSSSGMLTMMFISDDYWLFERFKTLATRMQVINFEDTRLKEASKILKSSRLKFTGEHLSDAECHKIYHLIGGRPQHLNYIASHQNMIVAAQKLIDSEKTWFLNNCALLGADMDDDVMESGKFSTSAMLLMREFVEMDRRRSNILHQRDVVDVEHLPELPMWRARQVMTRPDHIEQYDKLNIFTIGTDCAVRADSVPMMRAFHEIASDPAFDELLEETIDRISEIESLNRTREVVLKDLALGGKYRLKKLDNDVIVTLEEMEMDKSKEQAQAQVHTASDYTDGSPVGNHLHQDRVHEGERKMWWKRRIETYREHRDATKDANECKDCEEE